MPSSLKESQACQKKHQKQGGTSPEKWGGQEVELIARRYTNRFLCQFYLGMNIDMMKVGWTCPLQSTPWRGPSSQTISLIATVDCATIF